jgi:gliding motility-associated-like protein
VKTLPQIRPDETVYYCLNSFPVPIRIDGGIVNDVPNNYYYNWSTGATTSSIEVNEPGTYTVEVTEVMGCTNQRTITVLPSELATIQDIEVELEGESSTLSVLVSGSGVYEYALDDPFGPYQESNVFENVASGVRTVYVRDALGLCGIAEESVSIVGYPRFFTPNGDGENDVWGLNGFNSTFRFNGVVRIFDRQGKLVSQLSASQGFWDGTYRGAEMPASDYWFVATLEDGSRITGHFALRR